MYPLRSSIEEYTGFLYTGPVLRNITLSADPELIEAARERAEAEHTTLNQQFRLWLAEYAGKDDRADVALSVISNLQTRLRSGGKRFTREEMNER